MQEKKYKSQNKKILIITFLSGICLGLLSAWGILYYQRSHQAKNKDILSIENSKKSRPLSTKKTRSSDIFSQKEKPTTKIKTENKDTTSLLPVNKDNPNPSAGNVVVLSASDDDNIAQDELISVKTIYIPVSEDKRTRQQELDSLLIDDVTPQKKDILRIEFWRSPINYSGYRMSPDKLVLFGFYQPEEVSFEFKNQKIQIKYKDNIFILENTDDFKSLHLKRSTGNDAKNKK